MRTLLVMKPKQAIELPINYLHILQAVIYKAIQDDESLSEYIHNIGFMFNNRKYKIFTFSHLQGKYRIEDKRISFSDQIMLEIRTPDVYIMRRIISSIEKNGITFGNVNISDIEILVADDTVEDEEIAILMKTPMCVYETDNETKKTHFYSPFDEGFSREINNNFKRKYNAYYGVMPSDDILIEPVDVKKKDKFVTKYERFMITGWKGVYTLRGKRKYLDFLFQTGLGSKNSQGFGMFDIICLNND